MILPTDDEIVSRAPGARAASAGAHAALAPRLVTRGETHTTQEDKGSVAFIDWLGFTVALPEHETVEWVEGAVRQVFGVPAEDWSDTGGGWFGYEHRINLGPYGLLAFGGAAQRCTYHVELNAHACRGVCDWKTARDWGERHYANITRADLAHDDMESRQLSVALALGWLRDGSFGVNGRPPRGQLWDDLGSGRGKTLYVGSRGAGKLLRVYEKGKQLGDLDSPWVRAEVELRNKGRHIPWEVVTSPASYFAGAYPALAFLSTEQSRLRTVQRAGQISYDAMVENLRIQRGKHLGVMCQVYQGDASAVLARLVREGVPKRLEGFEDILGQISGGKSP